MNITSQSRLFLSIVVLLAASTASISFGERPGWRPHYIRVGDGRGGWTLKKVECQILHAKQRGWTCGFGIVQMDNGELAMLGTVDPGKSLWYGGGKGERAIIAFSKDRGDTWTDFQEISNKTKSANDVRPMLVAALGKGRLTYKSGWIKGQRFFSNDYGRTWEKPIPDPPVSNGAGIGGEGNPLVELGKDGKVHMAEIGYNLGGPGLSYDVRKPEHGFFRWSRDGGVTWEKALNPKNWYWKDTHKGKTWTRGISEGSLVRAKNGWLVASLRTGIPARGIDGPHTDQLEGTGISISKDDGKTWSKINFLYKTGRMHGHLLRMPNGHLVLTVTVRSDVKDGKLLSYRRGFEAIISRDNGLTWDLDRKYILDEWEFFTELTPGAGQAGHLSAALMDDGRIISIHNNYLTMGITLVRWKP